MISTVADLLEAFKRQETKLLDKQKILHAPTIGSMYEGLTRNILEKSIPENLDLRVVSGFITNSNGQISRQIDCMLVCGDGEKIPYTDGFKYTIENVIAIVEVKKSLYSTDIDSAYKNLASVRDLRVKKEPENLLFVNSYRQILQSDPNDYEDISCLPIWKRQIGLALYVESITPIRIAFGYHGFASEFSFRDAFIDYLENKRDEIGYGPTGFPNLMISGQYSLIKLNGMPYGIPIFKHRDELFRGFGIEHDPEDIPSQTTDLWALYASYSGNPITLFLQLIWTRLVAFGKISDRVFGLDLDVEFLRPLLLAKAIEHGNDVGWHYEYFLLGDNFLKSIPLSLKWEPVEINKEQAVVLFYLGQVENRGVTRVTERLINN